jgi:hypothetical protein
MDTNLPYSKIKRSSSSSPKARVGGARKAARLRGFSPLALGQLWPSHWPNHRPTLPPPILREPGAILAPGGPGFGPLHGKLEHAPLGPPLGIRQAAALIGCSPWTVRQTLIPRGLPYFRSAASGRLIFYTHQIVGWIESQQFQGGN